MSTDNIDHEDFKQDEYYGIMPPDGAFADSGNKYYLQKRPTVGGWVDGSEGFVQQTFLGASITDFNIAAGFNDSPSKLSVSLVVDEYNKSDKLPIGSGDDIYHNGEYDSFNPPPIGAPVFFKFGKNHASTVQAYLKSYEIIYKKPLLEDEALSFPVVDRREMDRLHTSDGESEGEDEEEGEGEGEGEGANEGEGEGSLSLESESWDLMPLPSPILPPKNTLKISKDMP